MTLVLTAEQLLDLQMDLDLVDDPLDPAYGDVFTDAELNRFYNRANGVYYKTVVLALRVLLVSSAKWANYTLGQSQEDRGERFQQVQATLTYYETVVLQGTTGQFFMIHIRPVPTPCRDRPYDRIYGYGYGYGYGFNGWGRPCGCGTY